MVVQPVSLQSEARHKEARLVRNRKGLLLQVQVDKFHTALDIVCMPVL